MRRRLWLRIVLMCLLVFLAAGCRSGLPLNGESTDPAGHYGERSHDGPVRPPWNQCDVRLRGLQSHVGRDLGTYGLLLRRLVLRDGAPTLRHERFKVASDRCLPMAIPSGERTPITLG